MLEDPAFGGDVQSWGAELELYLVDGQGDVAHINGEVLSRAANPQLTPELNRFNLEYNSTPYIGSGRPLSVLEREFCSALDSLSAITAQFGASPVAIGILPTVTEQDFGLQHMTDIPRYRALTAGLKKIGSADFRIDIEGEPPLKRVVDNVTFEGANTSFQLHYRVAPARFCRTLQRPAAGHPYRARGGGQFADAVWPPVVGGDAHPPVQTLYRLSSPQRRLAPAGPGQFRSGFPAPFGLRAVCRIGRHPSAADTGLRQ